MSSESISSDYEMRHTNRRDFLRYCGGLALTGPVGVNILNAQQGSGAGLELKQAAGRSGKLLSVFTGMHQVKLEPDAAAMMAAVFGMIADGNDLKFSDRLRPTPDSFDFVFGDLVVSWAEQNHLLFRGHCLIWWNALPSWFRSYTTAANVRDVLTKHISTVVKHYAGRVYSWDVVNEAIYHDNRPDGLRKKPWLDLLGPEYIDLAFHTAAAADPKARLILNECFIEHDTPAEIARRQSLLELARRLKRSGVPISGIGIQGHLRGATPLDRTGMTKFLQQVKDLGLEIMVTEFDVDDLDVPAQQIAQTTASKYGEFLDIVGPFAGSITLEALRNDPNLPRRADGVAHSPNLFDEQYRPTAAYQSFVDTLNRIASRNKT